jgi:transcriptional regulator with XRE-family HTH domain
MTTVRGSYGVKKESPATLGERIRAVRLSWGWTLKQLGTAIHYSHQAVWHWEKGIQVPGDPALGAVADLFGLTPEALNTGVGFRIPEPPRQVGSLLLAENYASDMVILPPNDAEHLICLDKEDGTHEQVSQNRLLQILRAAREGHRPVWLVLGAPVPQAGGEHRPEHPD